MKQRSRVNGTEYTLLERLPVLVGEAAYILCVDNDGNRALCPEELWRGGELAENQISSVNTHSSAQQKIDLFLSLFKGREDVYANATTAPRQGKADTRPSARTNGPMACATKRNIGAQTALIVNFFL